ncbi:MAG: IS4 family transposase [Gammaproteobacteria bacterium]
MFTDGQRRKVWDEIRQHDLRAFARLLPDELFAQAATEAQLRLADCALNLRTLVWLGVAAALHRLRNFAGVLQLTLKLLEDSEHWPHSPLAATRRRAQHSGKRRRRRRSKHDPHGHDPTQLSEEAFAQARQKMPLEFWSTLIVLLGRRFEQQHGDGVRWKAFRLLALDGTCIDLPDWKPLEDHFGRARNGWSKGPVQARMVMLQLPLARVPWRYTLGPLQHGEPTVAEPLLEQLQPDDLVLMDLGFWSYGLFGTVQDRRAFFAIRLRGNVRLRTLKRLGPKDRLVRWNKPNSPRWRQSVWPASIQLRVISYQRRGFRPSAVVTNVLNSRLVSREDWVRLASATEPGDGRLGVGLYHRRWEIETTFHELKVVQGMEGNLRSRTPAGIRYEVAGHVLLYLLVRWLMVQAAERSGADPLRLSFRHALEELIDMSQTLITSSVRHVRRVLLPRLLQRIARHAVPLRPGRHYSRPGDTKIKNMGNGNYRRPHKLARNTK